MGYFIQNYNFIVWAFSRGIDTVRPGNFSQAQCQDPVVSFWNVGQSGRWAGIRETEVCVKSKVFKGGRQGLEKQTEGSWLVNSAGEHSMAGELSCLWIGSILVYVNIFYGASTFITRDNRMFSLYTEDATGFTSEGWCFIGGSVVKNPPANVGDTGSIPELERSPGEGNYNPLQYSCLGNSMNRGAWRTTIHEVTKSQTRLSN